MNSHLRFPRRGHHRFYVSGFLLFLLFVVGLQIPLDAQPQAVQAAARVNAVESAVAQIDWLEPRGITIASLAGLVPEDHLRDAIISYRPGDGLVQYVSGQRNGSTVTIQAKLTPRYLTYEGDVMTQVGCLGQTGVYDEWMGAAPAAKMRVYSAGTEITTRAVDFVYTYAAQKHPDGIDPDPDNFYFRYAKYQGPPTFTGDGALDVQANMGCTITLRGRHGNLTAEFTMQDSSPIQVEVMGSETFPFHSYIGVGNAGQLNELREQMQRRHGSRHEKFTLSPPEGADYFLVAFPPTPAEPYPVTMADDNVPLPASGTYRIGREDNTLSVDHVASMAMPLRGQWQDADQSDGSYLKFFANGTRLAAPEYFIPTGVPYQSCMRFGGCSEAVLDQVFNTEMQMTIYYYRVTRVADVLTRIPLRAVGSRWESSAQQSNAITASAQRQQDGVVYLPLVRNPVKPTPLPTATPKPNVPDDNPEGCPCGWFDSIGRMFDYIPPQ